MAIIKCKMCGGDMELSTDKTFGTCECCGSVMTLPKLDTDQRAAQFNRGNHFRRTGEFDKALAIYEHIVQEDENDAEAHWCCALCRFGIEYVEDPATYEYLPTCHRASFDSFLEDVDYLAALEHSDGVTRRQYQKDAAKIAEVQRGILATSQNEESFDVFICYKETDESGERTRDSLMAQDIYYQLTQEGYRVFFSRITLEDKAGTEFEPYIFAALNSAKVMVAVGTKAEHFNAVWVKNEWSRFLAMMRKDRSKLLLPCYRDMDPYDLPEQLSVLQSYDMSKIGFVQDLIRGIKKVLAKDKPKQTAKETVVVQQTAPATNSNVEALLKRGFMALEDEEWQKADGFFEEVLNQDAENASAYLGKLMAELKVSKQENLKNCDQPFDGSNNYQKVLRFGSATLMSAVKGDIEFINDRNENERLSVIYQKAIQLMQNADTEQRFLAAAEKFESIGSFSDAVVQAKTCHERADYYRNVIETLIRKRESLLAELDKLKGPFNQKHRKEIEGQIVEVEEKLRSESISDKIRSASIGETILFGSYPQEKYEDEKQPIEWCVLAKGMGKMLVISTCGIDCQMYCSYISSNPKWSKWSNCSIRNWLNDSFYKNAFSTLEQVSILTTRVSSNADWRHSPDSDVETNDKLFLLSKDEVEKYFKSDVARQCKPTRYAISKGVYVANDGCVWWLRSLGKSIHTAVAIDQNGIICSNGIDVHNAVLAVRPAMWINLG